jgi:sterol desaturase/sphingolipid hydroxylase (fatty acid hydroxylase superfamily)
MPELPSLVLAPDGSPFSRVGAILIAMTVLALIEAAIPLRPRTRSNTGHLGPNLVLTLLTVATNLLFTGALVLVLAWQHAHGIGLLNVLDLPPLVQLVTVVLVLDLTYYVLHVAMHTRPALWRFHRVHHSDPAVDVTTTIRQHPGETIIRSAAIVAVALPLGASPGDFAIYQLLVALTGLLEHANVRLPPGVNRVLALVVTFTDMHKVHHSRDPRFTNTNYGNVVSLWDRAFGTFTPAQNGRRVAYGLDGLDDPALQTTAGLLQMPFQERPRAVSPSSNRSNRPVVTKEQAAERERGPTRAGWPSASAEPGWNAVRRYVPPDRPRSGVRSSAPSAVAGARSR